MTQQQDRQPRRFIETAGNGREAVRIIDETAHVEFLTYCFSIAIDERHWNAAHALGSFRYGLKVILGRKSWEDRGADNLRIDTEGALAEILLGLAFGTNKEVELTALADHRPVRDVDAKLRGKRVEVKSVGQERTLLNINCDQHKHKAPDLVVAVHFSRADVADVWVVNGSLAGFEHITKLRGMGLDPKRYHWRARLPDTLEVLRPADAED